MWCFFHEGFNGVVFGQFPITAAVSMGRCNTMLNVLLLESQRLKSLSSVESNGTLPWLGSAGVQPDRSVLSGKCCWIRLLESVASTGWAGRA